MSKERRVQQHKFLILFVIGCIGIGSNWNHLRFSFSSFDINNRGRKLRIHEYNEDKNNHLVIRYNETSRRVDIDAKFQEDKSTVSGTELNYRYPSMFSSGPAQQQQQQQQGKGDDEKYSQIVVGVLSSPENYHARERVRSTWGQDLEHRVYFIVGGDWGDVEQEFYTRGDLLWIDMKEDWLYLTYKVQTFFHAVQNHYGLPYEYILKTDDDSYVGLDVMNMIAKTVQPNYYGFCGVAPVIRDKTMKYYMPMDVYPHPFYPNYAQGMGYMISKEFTKCALQIIPKIAYMPFEDVATGLLAEKCGIECVNDPTRKSNQFPIRIIHKIDSHQKMTDVHRKQQNVMLLFPLISKRSQLRLLWPKSEGEEREDLNTLKS